MRGIRRGPDLFVALLGNEPKVMPPIELVIGRRRGRAAVRHVSVKNDDLPRRWRIHYREARLGAAVLEDDRRREPAHLPARSSCATTRASTTGSRPKRAGFLEVNPNPDLTRHTFERDVCFAGVPYPELISGIVTRRSSR